MSLLDRLERQKLSNTEEKTSDVPVANKINFTDEYSELKQRIHKDFIDIVNQQNMNLFNVKGEQDEELQKNYGVNY